MKSLRRHHLPYSESWNDTSRWTSTIYRVRFEQIYCQTLSQFFDIHFDTGDRHIDIVASGVSSMLMRTLYPYGDGMIVNAVDQMVSEQQSMFFEIMTQSIMFNRFTSLSSADKPETLSFDEGFVESQGVLMLGQNLKFPVLCITNLHILSNPLYEGTQRFTAILHSSERDMYLSERHITSSLNSTRFTQ